MLLLLLLLPTFRPVGLFTERTVIHRPAVPQLHKQRYVAVSLSRASLRVCGVVEVEDDAYAKQNPRGFVSQRLTTARVVCV